ncbi:unnamed protein product, partial [Linum tenue]
MDEQIQQMANRIEAKVRKYWFEHDEEEEEENLKINRLVYIACVLDPRRKLAYLSFMLDAMYGKSKGEALVKEVTADMTDMFE